MHYSVAVIHDEGTSIDEMLEPFDENGHLWKFVDCTEEVTANYLNPENTIRGFRTPDGKFHVWYGTDLRVEISEEEFHKLKAAKNGTDVFREYDKKAQTFLFFKNDPESFQATPEMLPMKEWISLDEYAIEHMGYIKRNKRYGYKHNPDAKWDWYVEGGRFADMIRTKDGGQCTEAKIKDIDFVPEEDEVKFRKRFWEVYVEDSPLMEGENKEDFFTIYNKEYYKKRFKTKENYARITAGFSTYAILNSSGEWLEAGPMGWFASSASEEEEAKWDQGYEDLIKEEDPELLLTIVDCHI